MPGPTNPPTALQRFDLPPSAILTPTHEPTDPTFGTCGSQPTERIVVHEVEVIREVPVDATRMVLAIVRPAEGEEVRVGQIVPVEWMAVGARGNTTLSADLPGRATDSVSGMPVNGELRATVDWVPDAVGQTLLSFYASDADQLNQSRVVVQRQVVVLAAEVALGVTINEVNLEANGSYDIRWTITGSTTSTSARSNAFVDGGQLLETPVVGDTGSAPWDPEFLNGSVPIQVVAEDGDRTAEASTLVVLNTPLSVRLSYEMDTTGDFPVFTIRWVISGLAERGVLHLSVGGGVVGSIAADGVPVPADGEPMPAGSGDVVGQLTWPSPRGTTHAGTFTGLFTEYGGRTAQDTSHYRYDAPVLSVHVIRPVDYQIVHVGEEITIEWMAIGTNGSAHLWATYLDDAGVVEIGGHIGHEIGEESGDPPLYNLPPDPLAAPGQRERSTSFVLTIEEPTDRDLVLMLHGHDRSTSTYVKRTLQIRPAIVDTTIVPIAVTLEVDRYGDNTYTITWETVNTSTTPQVYLYVSFGEEDPEELDNIPQTAAGSRDWPAPTDSFVPEGAFGAYFRVVIEEPGRRGEATAYLQRDVNTADEPLTLIVLTPSPDQEIRVGDTVLVQWMVIGANGTTRSQVILPEMAPNPQTGDPVDGQVRFSDEWHNVTAPPGPANWSLEFQAGDDTGPAPSVYVDVDILPALPAPLTFLSLDIQLDEGGTNYEIYWETNGSESTMVEIRDENSEVVGSGGAVGGVTWPPPAGDFEMRFQGHAVDGGRTAERTAVLNVTVPPLLLSVIHPIAADVVREGVLYQIDFLVTGAIGGGFVTGILPSPGEDINVSIPFGSGTSRLFYPWAEPLAVERTFRARDGAQRTSAATVRVTPIAAPASTPFYVEILEPDPATISSLRRNISYTFKWRVRGPATIPNILTYTMSTQGSGSAVNFANSATSMSMPPSGELVPPGVSHTIGGTGNGILYINIFKTEIVNGTATTKRSTASFTYTITT